MISETMILIAHMLLVLAITARVLYRPDMIRSSRLAWSMVLFFLPVIGVVLYLLFGEARVGRAMQERYKKLTRIAEHYYDQLPQEKDYPAKIKPQYQNIAKYAETLNDYPALSGNHVELMADAEDFRTNLIKDIDAAKSSVSILYYIWLNDNTGQSVAEALSRASERGVTVRVMVDSLGSRLIFKSKLWQRLVTSGVDTKGALPLTRVILTFLTRRLDVRNHRKITVIDGRITYCGSQNCSDPEFRTKPKYAPWVDIMTRVEGPVVNQNQLLFAVDWMVDHELDVVDFDLEGAPQKENQVAQIWGAGPTIRQSATQQLLITMIMSASREIRITTPYFVPDEPILEALCAAARRGVNISVIFPNRNDSFIVRYASQSFYPVLLEAGIKIREYQGGLLHAKIMTIDGEVTLIGSTNLDMRSFDLNYENNLLVYDADFTKQVNERQDVYETSTVLVDLKEVQAWPRLKVIWNNLFATLGPIL